MQRIPRLQICDYLYYSIGLYLFIVIFMPFHTQEFFELFPGFTSTVYCLPVIVGFFVDFLIGELVATYLFGRPSDYSQSLQYQLQRTAAIAIPCITLNAVFDLQYFQVIQYGTETWEAAWIDADGHFTLDHYWVDFRESVFVGLLTICIYLFQTYNRMQRYQIHELRSINQLLDAEQEMQRLRLRDDSACDQIVIQGEGRDALTVNPHDIMYVESVGNYLNIVYFHDSDLCQKRLRRPLKEVEEMLGAFPFMVHVHRAFLVNINFITQVSGNSNGYRISLFSTDRILPVSKANVAQFRDKVRELGKGL